MPFGAPPPAPGALCAPLAASPLLRARTRAPGQAAQRQPPKAFFFQRDCFRVIPKQFCNRKNRGCVWCHCHPCLSQPARLREERRLPLDSLPHEGCRHRALLESPLLASAAPSRALQQPRSHSQAFSPKRRLQHHTAWHGCLSHPAPSKRSVLVLLAPLRCFSLITTAQTLLSLALGLE